MEENSSGKKQTHRASPTGGKKASVGKKKASAEKKDEYAIGRGKPPKHTQFKKGDGRPRPGRPKGSKNIVTLIQDAARDQVNVTIDGKSRKISKAQAAAIHLANAGATGNEKLLLKFIDLIANIEARAEAARPSDYPFSEVDKIVIEQIYRRLRPYDERESS
jgi:hypothetical protein